MKREELLSRLHERYIAPTKKDDGLFAGVEIELPVINLAKKAVDFSVIHELTRSFKERFGFYVSVIDEDRNPCSLVNFANDDILSYDCSYNNLELSFGRERDLNTVAQRFHQYYAFINEVLARSGYTLSGLGVNPYRAYNSRTPIPNGRYRMLFHHLSSYEKYLHRLPMFFHTYPHYGMFSSASQVQLDVRHEDLIGTIRAFSLLEPLKSVLFSNSVLTGENEDVLCCRDMLWENSTHGINPHNVGMFEEIPSSVGELLEYISSMSIYCTEQDGRYINFEPINIAEYFARETLRGEYYDKDEDVYKEIEFSPRESDLGYLRSFKFEDLTFRGTLEFRSVCCQPIRDTFAVSAFHLGLIGQTEELNEIFDSDEVLYRRGYSASELRRLFNRRMWPEFAERASLSKLIVQVLHLSRRGLAQRGFGEEKYIEPLFVRAESLSNPAIDLLEHTDAGGKIEDIITEYAAIS